MLYRVRLTGLGPSRLHTMREIKRIFGWTLQRSHRATVLGSKDAVLMERATTGVANAIKRQLLMLEAEVELEPLASMGEFEFQGRLDDLWKPRKDFKFGLVLQGGGMRGAFQVGVLNLLQRHDLINRRDFETITSASTGSLSTMALFSDDGTDASGVDIATQSYLEMTSIDDMLKLREPIQLAVAQSATAKTVVDDLLQTGQAQSNVVDLLGGEILRPENLLQVGRASHAGGFAGAATGATIGGVAGGPAGVLIGGLIGLGVGAVGGFIYGSVDAGFDEMEKFKRIAKGLMETEGSIALLDPVKETLLSAAKPRNLKRIELRMALTSYASGATCYLTEKATLLVPLRGFDTELHDFDETVECEILSADGERDYDGIMLAGTLASSAFPGIFPPVAITYVDPRTEKERTEYFGDGGIRENLPLEAALDTGVNECIAVFCDPIQQDEQALFTLSASEKSNSLSTAPPWPSVLGRATQLMFAEINRGDAEHGRALNLTSYRELDDYPTDVIHIAPGVPTLHLTEVDPYAIRCTLLYGYLRAFDELLIARWRQLGASKSATDVHRLRSNTDEIYLAARAVGMSFLAILRTMTFSYEHSHPLDASDLGTLKTLISSGTKDAPFKGFWLNDAAVFNYLSAKRRLAEAIRAREESIDFTGTRHLPEGRVQWPDEMGADLGDNIPFFRRPFFLEWWTPGTVPEWFSTKPVVRRMLRELNAKPPQTLTVSDLRNTDQIDFSEIDGMHDRILQAMSFSRTLVL